MRPDPLIPNLAVVTDIRVDTPDVKTFRVVGLDGKKPFVHIPGQCAMLSVPGVGEALFSITSSPTLEEYVEFSIKKCGCVTEWLHAMEQEDGINVHLTIDREQPEWDGHVGFVPNYVKELDFTTDKTVVMCGPPIMIKFTLAGLMELGFAREQVYTTMELKMKCGLGKCGRCNIGDKYVCKDGPVFRFDQLDELPNEY